jgi:hypothetical protein
MFISGVLRRSGRGDKGSTTRPMWRAEEPDRGGGDGGEVMMATAIVLASGMATLMEVMNTGFLGSRLLGVHQARAEASVRRRPQLTLRCVLRELNPGEG